MNKKIIPLQALNGILSKLKASGKRIVFTNGCFDILHSGHVALLQKAGSFGDVLVVGINSDASVKRLKGDQRPVQPLADRACVLSALSAVDLVVSFSEDTPEKLIRAIKPDVLVKGGDYKIEDIVGRQYAKKVVRVPLLKGRSTTGIINKLRSL